MNARNRDERRRAGSGGRDAKQWGGGDWSSLRIPDGLTMWQPKEGTHKLNILCYKVGEGNPCAPAGSWYYERTFWVHKGIGDDPKKNYVCLSKTFGKRCPVCDHRAALMKSPSGDEELAEQLRPKQRQLWLVNLIGVEDAPAVQLYETSYHTFGKLLDMTRKDAEADEDHIANFDDWNAGATLKVNYENKDAGGFNFLNAYRIDFKPRPNGLDEELMDHGFCLDEMLKEMSYDELKAILFQTESDDGDDDDEPEKPAKGRTRGKPADDKDEDDDEPAKKRAPTAAEKSVCEGDMVRHRKYGLCEVVQISSDGRTLRIKDEDGETHRDLGWDDVRVEPLAKPPKGGKAKPADDEDEDDDPPAKKPGKAKPPADEDEDDAPFDNEEEDEDDPPAKRGSSQSGGKKSPAGSKPGKTKTAPTDEDEWDDEDDPAPAKKPSGKKKPADDDDGPPPKSGKKNRADDEDDDWD